jgi:3-oxoacyl-(acyl-carrier-protein) synthase
MVLEHADRARARGARALAEIVSAQVGAVSGRPYEFSDPAAYASRMLELCAPASRDSIDAMVGGADGTAPREAIDRALIELLRARKAVAYLPWKRLVGDWPSAGALAAVLAVLAIDRQALPGAERLPGDSTASPPRRVLVPGAARAGVLVPVLVARPG